MPFALVDQPSSSSTEGLERTAVIEVGDRVEFGDVAERVGFAVDTLIPPVVEETGLQAAELDVGFINVDEVAVASIGVVVGVELSGEEAGERAMLGVALGVERDVSAREGIPVRRGLTPGAFEEVDFVVKRLSAASRPNEVWKPPILRQVSVPGM
ncbi:hypothetical protein D9M68_425960 [compost metagenome]